MEMSGKFTIISGGQTGADRGALDAAIGMGFPHGGWCPKGRRAEDGAVPSKYLLQESASPNYIVRTKQNIESSNCTLIYTLGDISGGSMRTWELASKLNKPALWIDLSSFDGLGATLSFLERHQPQVLNVAGSRESKNPGLQRRTEALYLRVLVRLLGL
jgi:hypothetical protein